MKWLDNEQTQSVRNVSPIIFKKTGFVAKSCFPYTNPKYKYRFIINSLLFSSAVEGDINAIFITTNDLNDAKQILIKRKLYKGIGVIFISEIENWDKKKHLALD